MASNSVVIITTNLGTIAVELNPAKAPKSVANFLAYVDQKFYDGTIFHRVIPNFMIQGGGFTAAMTQKETKAPIAIESSNGLKNDRGTIAMARTGDPNSATSQFFVNLVNNDFLNFKNPSPQGIGYTVFGKVIAGMEVVDQIATVRTATVRGMENVPATPVTIESVRRQPAK